MVVSEAKTQPHGVTSLMYIGDVEEDKSPVKCSIIAGTIVGLLSLLFVKDTMNAVYLGLIAGGLTLAAKPKTGG